MPLRLCWHGLRWLLLGLGLLLALAVLAWCGLHWIILPHADDWRPWLEKEASKTLGVELRIGHLAVDSGGWLPRMQLQDVRVLDSAGRPALRLPRVSAVLSAQSLLVLQPRFAQLLVDTPELEIRRDTSGRLFVAGLDVESAERTEASGASEAWLDWIFSQPELAIVHGRIRWTDELRAAQRREAVAPLALSDLNLVIRNGLRRHQLRVDATPPQDWGQRFTLRGQFTQALLKRPGEFQHWSGQLFAELPQADLSQLRRHVDLPFQLSEGDGALRAWAEVAAGQPTSATLDLALRAVKLRLLESAPELDLTHIQGRLELAQSKGKLNLQARQLGFVGADGMVWPRSDWGIALQLGPKDVVTGGELNAQRLDFALMTQISQRLPLGERAHRMLEELDPQGVLTALSAQWQGPLEAPRSYRVKAQVDGLAIAAGSVASADQPGRPGLRGASVQLEANEQGGSAKLAMQDGQVELPGLFEDPILPITRLSTQISWKLSGSGDIGSATKGSGELELRLRNLVLQTPDLNGEFELLWRRPRGSSSTGFLDLTGLAQRLEATRVARYIPLSLPQTRSYLNRALLAGEARNIHVRLRGDLADFPFDAPRATGIFRVATQAQGVTLAYVPPSEVGTNWPAMDGVDAELVFERGGMAIHNGRARVLGYELNGVNGGIQDLARARVLALEGNGRGQGVDLLRFVRSSPLDEWLDHALTNTSAQGTVALKLSLNLPLDHIDQSTVKGQLQLGNVDLKLRPDLPLLAATRGRIDFDQKSLSVSGVTTRLLGGEASVEGGSQRDGALRFSAQGIASAEGLRRTQELGAVSHIAQAANGQAAYRFQLSVKDGQTELSVASNLQGMGLDLPAPAHKEAEAALPLRLLMTPTGAGRDELRLELGSTAAPLLQAQLQRDVSGPSSRVLRGAIALQDKLPALPASGVLLQASPAQLDLDAWQQRLATLGTAANPAAPQVSAPPALGSGLDELADLSQAGLLPSQIQLRTQALKIGGRAMGRVQTQIVRDGGNWRLDLDAEHLTGRIELRGVNLGRGGNQIEMVRARLSRLQLPKQEADSVTQLMDPASTANTSPLPALDIEVDDFELRGKHLGRLEVQAQVPTGAREWQLDRLRLSSPDATLTANGRWGGTSSGRRRTELDWKLDVVDAGKLLERLGQGQVLRGGKGHLSGQLGWTGSPLDPNYPSMAGNLNLQLDTGTFLKAEPGVGRLLGVLSLQSLPRRLLLDFRDVFAEGFTFDGVSGDVKIAAGVARSDNIRIRGLQAVVLVEGSTDLAQETQKLRVLVVPEVSAGGASLAYAAINPAIALGAFLAQLLLSRPVAAASTREFLITGSWDDPKVEKIDKVEEAAAAASAASASATPARR